MHHPLFLLLPLLLLASATPSPSPRCLRHPIPLTPTICARPPVAPVSPTAYLGLWYQIYVNPRALRISAPACVTARYTAAPRGRIGVLNCQSSPADARAQCVQGEASRAPGGGAPGRLQVRFGPSPAGAYNIAALVGEEAYGYSAAAVFSCRVVDGRAQTGWFFLARNPYRPRRTMWELARRLRCKGYDIYSERLIETRQGKGCRYFFGEKGFDTNQPRRGPPAARG